MIQVKKEISREEFEQVKAKDDPYILINENIIMGYGASSAQVYEKDGKYYLSYWRGNSCD